MGIEQGQAGPAGDCYREFFKVIALLSVKTSRVSDGTRTRSPEVITSAAVPAAPPDRAPIAAPFPPPAIAPIRVPKAAVPPITSVDFVLREPLSLETEDEATHRTLGGSGLPVSATFFL